jgi:hypothetical protein
MDVLVLDAFGVHLALGQGVEHEGVIGVGAVGQLDRDGHREFLFTEK